MSAVLRRLQLQSLARGMRSWVRVVAAAREREAGHTGASAHLMRSLNRLLKRRLLGAFNTWHGWAHDTTSATRRLSRFALALSRRRSHAAFYTWLVFCRHGAQRDGMRRARMGSVVHRLALRAKWRALSSWQAFVRAERDAETLNESQLQLEESFRRAEDATSTLVERQQYFATRSLYHTAQKVAQRSVAAAWRTCSARESKG